MRVAIYARQSVEKQDSVSIQTQIDECKRLVRTGDVVEIYQDEGFSGKNTERPDFKRLLSDIEYNTIGKVIVYKLDRFSRNVTDFNNIHEMMEQHNCSFESVTDKFDTSTSQGRFFMQILASFAQMERENTAQRVRDSYYQRAKTDGRWLGGREPFGYRRCKRDGKSSLEPNEYKDLVIQLYKKYADDANTSLHQLVKYSLDNYSAKLSATQIKNILSNPIYVKADKKLYDYYKLKDVKFVNEVTEFDGRRALQIINKTDQTKRGTVQNDASLWVAYIANWPGMIDSRTFIVVQERLSQNKSYATSNKPTNKMMELSGLIKCAKCGHTVKMKGKYGTMSCVGRSEYRGYCNASFAGVRLANIQKLVADEMQDYFANFNQKVEDEVKAKHALRGQMEQTKQEINRLLQIAEQSEILQQATLDRIEKKQKHLTALELEWANGVYATDKIESRVLHKSFRTGLKVVYEEMSTEEKQSLLRILVEKILLHEDGSIDIVWKK